MDIQKLSSMEIDAIGEILNISLGASATAISTMLDARVDITTPVVQVKGKDEFEFGALEPAVGVEIVYIEGLTGSNIMLLKRNDVRVIVEMLMGMEIPEEEFELDEMNISAICEVMNQMMGASATALSELLGDTVNISTPVSFEVESPEQFKEKYFTEEVPMVVIGFTLRITDKMESEFINLMPIGLAKELVAGFFSDGVPDAKEDTKVSDIVEAIQDKEEPAAEEAAAAMASEPEAQPAVAQAAQSAPEPVMPEMPQSAPQSVMPEMPQSAPQPMVPEAAPSAPQPVMPEVPQSAPQPMMQGQPAVAAVDPQFMNSMAQMMDLMRQQMEMQQLQMQQLKQAKPADPKQIKVNPVPQPNLEQGSIDGDQQESNLELIMGVPLEVSVEIGRTKKLVKDVLELNKGSLVVLDKLAGEQVDLFVNGQCIAHGDVVVVDDNFGIRITEILAEEIMVAQ